MAISTETWQERVKRLFDASTVENQVERHVQAHFDADKEMLNEIHEMLRHLIAGTRLGH